MFFRCALPRERHDRPVGRRSPNPPRFHGLILKRVDFLASDCNRLVLLGREFPFRLLWRAFALLLVILPAVARSQGQEEKAVRTVFTDADIRVDGLLDEPGDSGEMAEPLLSGSGVAGSVSPPEVQSKFAELVKLSVAANKLPLVLDANSFEGA